MKLTKDEIEYPRDVFQSLISGNSPYAFYLFQWVPYQTEAKRWRLKMCHDVRTFDGREAHGIWPNGSSCGPFKDEEVEFIRISRTQHYAEWADPRAAAPAITEQPEVGQDNNEFTRCQHPDCGRFKNGTSWSCRAMQDNACARPSAAPQEGAQEVECECLGSKHLPACTECVAAGRCLGTGTAPTTALTVTEECSLCDGAGTLDASGKVCPHCDGRKTEANRAAPTAAADGGEKASIGRPEFEAPTAESVLRQLRGILKVGEGESIIATAESLVANIDARKAAAPSPVVSLPSDGAAPAGQVPNVDIALPTWEKRRVTVLSTEWCEGEILVCAHIEDTTASAAPAQAAGVALAEMEARKNAAYLERNQVVAALAKCFPSGVARTAIEGWSEDWHGCVYIDLPTGQVSWHFHDSQAYLFDGLPAYTKPWDGHDTPEKYRRVAALAATPSEAAPVGQLMTLDQIVELAAPYEFNDPDTGKADFDRLGFARAIERRFHIRPASAPASPVVGQEGSKAAQHARDFVDAERYRWLRSHYAFSIVEDVLKLETVRNPQEQMDSAITEQYDAALSTAPASDPAPSDGGATDEDAGRSA